MHIWDILCDGCYLNMQEVDAIALLNSHHGTSHMAVTSNPEVENKVVFTYPLECHNIMRNKKCS